MFVDLCTGGWCFIGPQRNSDGKPQRLVSPVASVFENLLDKIKGFLPVYRQLYRELAENDGQVESLQEQGRPDSALNALEQKGLKGERLGALRCRWESLTGQHGSS
jgi:hypothetical protein